MTFWEALGIAAAGFIGVAAFIGMLLWTFIAWEWGGEWPERLLNSAAWILVIAVAVWFASRAVVPA